MLMWQVWQVLWCKAVEGRDILLRLGDGLCAEKGVGAAYMNGVVDGDFSVGDADDG